MVISLEKAAALNKRMADLSIKEEDLIEKFITGSGKGGQKVNKTSSTVYLKHIPSGIEIKCQASRSQSENRFFARRDLCDKLEAEILGEKSKQQQEFEKIRRQKKRRSRRQKEIMVDNKKRHSVIKSGRKPPSE